MNANRNYNEDRVSIILNIIKPSNKKVATWPKCALFGVYDGHGGSHCADFLRDHLHHFITKDRSFPMDPLAAISQGFASAEETFIEHCETKGERSGSCAIVAFFVEDTCYVANVGDSRAVLSENAGKTITGLSEDHKPNYPTEFDRILTNGGTVYQ